MTPYQNAICRRPGPRSVEGLTTAALGPPDSELLLAQWDHYRQTLEALGVAVTVLDPVVDMPDSYFVEDVAVVTPEIAVLCRPGAPARRDEPRHMIDTLAAYREVTPIEAPGTIDGGDVLVVGKHCLVGLSERTNPEGARQLIDILARHGYRGEVAEAPDALHFKSSVNFIDEESLLVTRACRDLPVLGGYRLVSPPEGEEYAANVVWINGKVLMAAGFPGTRDALQEAGAEVLELDVSEIEKMDGGLTCLSLRLT